MPFMPGGGKEPGRSAAGPVTVNVVSCKPVTHQETREVVKCVPETHAVTCTVPVCRPVTHTENRQVTECVTGLENGSALPLPAVAPPARARSPRR